MCPPMSALNFVFTIHHHSLLLPALLNKLMPIKYGIRNGMAGIDVMLLTVSKGLIKDIAMIRPPKKLIVT